MKRKMPGAMWISIGALGTITLMQLLIGVQKGSKVLLITVVLNVALGAGLLLGHKWAYVVTLVLGILGLIVALGKNPEYTIGILIGNGLVIVPMLMSTRFFFRGQSSNLDTEEPGVERAQHPDATNG